MASTSSSTVSTIATATEDDEESPRPYDDDESPAPQRRRGPAIPAPILMDALSANAKPLPNTTYCLRDMRKASELALGVIRNMTTSTSVLHGPRAAKEVLMPEVLSVLVPLLEFQDSDLLRLRVGEVLDNVSKLEEGHKALREAGAIQTLVRVLEDLSRKERAAGGVSEATCKAALGTLRSLTSDPEGFEEVEETDVPMLVLQILIGSTTGSTPLERALAAGCMAHLCDRRRDYMAYRLCAAGVLTHLLPMIRTSEDELSRLCACAALNRLASCKRTHPFFAQHPEVVSLLVELFEVDESPHGTHVQVRMVSLWSLVYLVSCPALHGAMVDQHVVDLVLDILDNHDPDFTEKVHLAVLMFGLDSVHTRDQVFDVVWTYMRALKNDEALIMTWPTSLFLGYVLTHVQDDDGQKAEALLQPIAELQGMPALTSLAGDLTLPLLIRENAWKVLFLLCEDYRNYPAFIDAGILTLCCEYQQPTVDGSPLINKIARTMLQATVIYDPALVVGYITSEYPQLKRSLLRRIPEADALLIRIKENRRFWILERESQEVLEELKGKISEEEVQGIKDIFIQFDADCSASIDTNELRKVFVSLDINLNFLQLRAIMNAADSDKSGSIELGEFVRVLIDFREGKITGLGYIRDVIKEEVEKTVAVVKTVMDQTGVNFKTMNLGKTQKTKQKNLGNKTMALTKKQQTLAFLNTQSPDAFLRLSKTHGVSFDTTTTTNTTTNTTTTTNNNDDDNEEATRRRRPSRQLLFKKGFSNLDSTRGGEADFLRTARQSGLQATLAVGGSSQRSRSEGRGLDGGSVTTRSMVDDMHEGDMATGGGGTDTARGVNATPARRASMKLNYGTLVYADGGSSSKAFGRTGLMTRRSSAAGGKTLKSLMAGGTGGGGVGKKRVVIDDPGESTDLINTR